MKSKEQKEYSSLIASLSIDYQMGKITWKYYINMLDLVLEKN